MEPRDPGFTLVEIVIGMVVVGVLSATVVVGLGRLVERGGASACAATRDAISTATTTWFALNGTYPTNLASMVQAHSISLPADATLVRPDVVRADTWTLTYAPAAGASPPTVTCSTDVPPPPSLTTTTLTSTTTSTSTSTAASTTTTTSTTTSTATSTTTAASTTTASVATCASSSSSTVAEAITSRLRNFGNANGGDRLYLGPNLSTDGAPNRTQALGQPWRTGETYRWSLTYDPATDTLTQVVRNQSSGTSTSLAYSGVTAGTAATRPQSASPPRWTVIRISITNRANTTIRLSAIAISACPQLTVADLVPAANSSATAYVTAPFGTAFTISGNLELSGNFPSSQELNKVELGLG